MAKKIVSVITKDASATWDEALNDFLYLKKAQGRSKTTIEDYQRYVNYFFKRFPDAFNSHRLKPSILQYMSDDIKPASFNLRREYLNAFFSWCVEEGILTKNPFIDIPKRKDSFRNVNIDNCVLTKLLSLPNKETWSGLRDYGLLTLSLDTGIRPSEAFSLLVTDVNLKSYEIHIRAENAKTRESRTLPIVYPTADAIKKLIKARHNSWDNKIPVFCTYQGTPLNRKTWNKRMELYSSNLGLKIRPYDLRHAFALQYLRNGGHALALQRTMGHSDLTMTKRYVALTQQDLREQHATASPLNTLLPKKQRVRNIKKS